MSYRLPSLASLAGLPRVTPTALSDLAAARRTAKLLGRGPGSGKGKTAARGHKGQGKTGTGKGPGFEGGQTPMHRLLPKHGFTNVFRTEHTPLNVGRLQLWLDQGRLDPTRPVTQHVLAAAGLLQGCERHGVKLLGGGRLSAPLQLDVARASKAAIEAVEAAGGTVVCVYRNSTAQRAHVLPARYTVPPRAAQPTRPKDLQWYSQKENRGYLA